MISPASPDGVSTESALLGPGRGHQSSDATAVLRNPVTADVDAVAFSQGLLPRVCVNTGMPASEWLEASYKSKIGAQWFLLLLGIFPLVLVRVLTVKRANGFLPVNRKQTDELIHRTSSANAELARRYMRRVGVIGPVLAVIGVLCLAVVVAREVSNFRSEVSGAQAAWDDLSREVPFEFPGFDDLTNDPYTAVVAINADGCILEERHFDDPTHSEYSREWCRPDPAREFTFQRSQSDPVTSIWAYVPEFDPALDPPIEERSWVVGQRINLAPFAWLAGAILVASVMVAAIIYLARKTRVRGIPWGTLDRAGGRLTLHRVNSRFAEAARPRPLGMSASGSAPPQPVTTDHAQLPSGPTTPASDAQHQGPSANWGSHVHAVDRPDAPCPEPPIVKADPSETGTPWWQEVAQPGDLR